jgi:uncharacterized membrane protein YhaH (DUF805 family)
MMRDWAAFQSTGGKRRSRILIYAVAAKRFQDRNKPGSTALYGLIPGIIAFLVPVYGLHDSWQEPNALGWIAAFIEWGVSLWLVLSTC